MSEGRILRKLRTSELKEMSVFRLPKEPLVHVGQQPPCERSVVYIAFSMRLRCVDCRQEWALHDKKGMAMSLRLVCAPGEEVLCWVSDTVTGEQYTAWRTWLEVDRNGWELVRRASMEDS